MRREDAAAAIEYAILAAFIAAVVVAAVMVLGQQTGGLFRGTADSVQRGFDARTTVR